MRLRRAAFTFALVVTPGVVRVQQPAPITRTDIIKRTLPPGEFRTVEAVVVELARVDTTASPRRP